MQTGAHQTGPWQLACLTVSEDWGACNPGGDLGVIGRWSGLGP